MKKILLSALLVSLCSAIHLNAQTIKFNVSNYHNEPLMLVYMVGSDGFERKEIKIENNKGSIIVTPPLYTQMSVINRSEKNNIKSGQGIILGESIMLFAEGKDMTVDIDMNKWPACTIKGGLLAADCMKLWSRTAPLKAEAFELTRKSVTATNDADSKKYMAERVVYKDKISAIEEQFVLDNPNSYLSLYLLSGQRNSFEVGEFERRFNLLDIKLKALPEAIDLAGFIGTKKSTSEGCAAPAFEKTDKNGKVVKLSDYKGSYLLIDFWGTWCGPCRDSHPHLVELYKKYSPQGLRFLNVAQESSLKARQRWLDAIVQDKLEWTQILNDEGIEKCNMVSLFAITAFPTKVLISPDGKVVCRMVGEDADIDNVLSGIFKDAVSKKAVLSGTIDCYKGEGNLLCISDSPAGAVYDTIKVNSDGSFLFEKDCPKPFMAKVYLEFLGNDRCVYDVYMLNAGAAKVAITGTRNDAGKMETDIRFAGDYSAESEFVKNYNKAQFGENFSLVRAAAGNFKTFQSVVKTEIERLRSLLNACTDKDLKKEYEAKLDYDQKCIPFRFCWAKRGAGEKMDADPDFVTYVNSFDLNDMTYIQVTEQILRWKMGCNPTEENNRIREMKLAKEIISNEEVVNKIAGDIMNVTLASGGGDDLIAVFEQYKKTTTNQKEVESFMPVYSALAKLTKGVLATNFEMQDEKGGKVNFLDVIGKGKVVYVDFWATWCGPCCAEIPFVEKLVEKYKNNPNIEFLSISLDDKPAKWHAKLAEDKPQWRQFIIPDNFKSDFAKEYNIRAIPRFMMFDKQGKIISVNAARPSDPQIDKILMDNIK